MNWLEVRTLRGANVWSPAPVMQVDLNLSGLAQTPDQFQIALARLQACVPNLGGSDATENPALSLAQAFQRLTLALQQLAGSPVTFGVALPTNQPDVFRVVAEYEEEALGIPCLEAARRLCLHALRGEAPDADAEIATLRDLAHDVRLGPSTAAIVVAAKRQGIPARRLNDGSLVQLGQGAKQRRIWTAETDRTGAIAEAIAQDKDLTRELLRGAGVPMPEGRPVHEAGDAWAAAEEIGHPVVVKPRFGNHGRGVTTNLSTREQVVRAFAAAREHGEVVVERYLPGTDFRLLVIGGQLVAAALREPPQVVGDGTSTVAELVAVLNRDPRRSDGHATALSVIKLDAIALAVLAEQGLDPDSVPAVGERVIIRRNANLSSGGTATDVTDRVHPRTAASAVAAARALGLDIAGVDVVAPSIDRPLEESGGAIVEVNAGPGLRMHLEPSSGTPRPVGEAIVRMLFPDGSDGRIPLVAITGDNAKTVTPLIAHLLATSGHFVGMAGTAGYCVGGRQVHSHDSSGPQTVQAVLLNPRVTAAVLEATEEGVLREGLGFDHCDIFLMTSHGDGEQAIRVRQTLVKATAPTGAAVLNADDPVGSALASACPGSVIYFAHAANEIVTAHLAQGGRAVFVREGRVVFVRGDAEVASLALDEILMTGGRNAIALPDILAAAAGGWAMGLHIDEMRVGLATFVEDGPTVSPCGIAAEAASC